MPTPVSTARQCLTDEAARALDDAVAVARRRSHAQTTSLHAVSALLALPSSSLRDACARARSCAYSPRLQFRALELSVSVSLDRLPTAKTLDEPPISNSLMAAIKRSQANQRRHPDTFHIYQQLQQQNTSNFSISTLKVELKHFILSILDDPIVSRVFGEAGFRSCDIKLAILNPPAISRFSKTTRCPPLFLCTLTDSELNNGGYSFPFSGVPKTVNIDENSRRIGEILVKKVCRNPLLIGICASDALCSFTDCVQKGKSGVLPDEIKGLSVISVEKEISEFIGGGGSEEMMSLKFKEVSDAVECCTAAGTGIIVNYGELKEFVDDDEESVKYVVSRFTKIVEDYSGKLWLIGAAANYDIYMKFLGRFPTIQKDWDLHLLPITASSTPGLPSKSSLMGSFVPLGGFFSTASEIENSCRNKNESTARCKLCNEKYEQEVSTMLRGTTGSVADEHATHLSSWLQKAECGPSRGLVGVEANEDNSLLNARLMGLQKKWNDICQRLHHIHPFQPDALQARSHLPSFGIFQSCAAGVESSNKGPLLDARFSNQSCMLSDLQNTSMTQKNMSKSIVSDGDSDSQAELLAQSLETQQLKKENIWASSPHAPHDLSLPLDRTSSASNACVSTDLGLGTIYVSTERELWRPSFQEHQDRLHYVSGSVSSASSVPQLDNKLDAKDFKNLYKALSEHVCWQEEAIYAISQTVSRCRSGNGRRHGSSKGNNIWLSFLGPDKVGKHKIAKALAEKVFGCSDSMLSVDLSSSDGSSYSNSLFSHQDTRNGYVNLRGKTVVDYIVEELSKKRCSLVLLENIEKADFLVQNSLSHSIRTGKFLNLHGKEISINNMIFVITSNSAKVTKDFFLSPEFSEENILAAKNLQMQIAIGSGNLSRIRVKNTNLWITSGDRTSESFPAYKRKQTDSNNGKLFQMPKRMCSSTKSSLDLNLPVEEMQEENEHDECERDSGSEGSKAWLEEILEQMDDNVVFKPYDFGALAEKILKEVNFNLQEIVGVDIKLEIDSEVMAQILAAAWLSDRREAVKDWVDKVLRRSFMEVRSRFQHIADSFIRLVNCQGIAVEDQAPGIHLPAKIIVD